MSEYLISIIVPAHNVEYFISRCLQSLIDQTYKNIEILVVNDHSTDSTLEIMHKYEKKDSRVFALSCIENGVSAARNFAINRAKGSFIACVDSDDYVENNYIETLITAYKTSNADMITCGATPIDESGNKLDFSRYDSHLFEHDEAIKSHLLFDDRVGHTIWGKLIKTEWMQQNPFAEGRFYEDTALIYKLIAMSNSIYYVDYNGYYYTHRSGSITNREFDKMSFGKSTAFYEMAKFFDCYQDGKYSSLANNLFIANANYCFINAYNNLQYDNQMHSLSIQAKEISKSLSIKYKFIRLCILYFPKMYIKLIKLGRKK